MPSDHFWICVDSLATEIDGSPVQSEEALDQIERKLTALSKAERDKRRRQMTIIVAQLARIEVRMMEADGPLGH